MNRLSLTMLLVLLPASLAVAAGPSTYQVTGPVLAVTPDVVTVQKGQERWEIGRDGATRVNGDLEVGAKVTIEYRMTAATVEVKAAK